MAFDGRFRDWYRRRPPIDKADDHRGISSKRDGAVLQTWLCGRNSGRRTEDETRAAHIENHLWLMRFVHLAPQPPHMNIDEVGLGGGFVVPHLFQQHAARPPL